MRRMTEQRALRLPLDASDAVGEDTSASAPAESRWTTLAATMAQAVRRQCPAWLSASADDIAQAALIKVMAAERRAEGERPVSAFYLHRAAHSALVDELRRRQRRQEISLEGGRGPADQQPRFEPSAQGDPETSASYRELGTAVRDCLLCAKRDRRLAVVLYLKGHSVQETARILGWQVKRTDNLIYRGLADLRQCLLRKGHRP
jgi:RNA polymerase sigma-70 factor (ECF subfamily)